MKKTDVIALHWIGGRWVPSSDGAVSESLNPATGEVLGRFAAGGKVEAEAAISAAREVFEKTHWAHEPRRRAKVLLDYANQLEAARADLVKTLSEENGKLIHEAEGEVDNAISETRYYAGLARNIFSRMTEIEPGLFSLLAREPRGVAGIIVPWNGPVILLIRALTPALAAGCTAVIKVAPQTSLISVKLMECLARVSDLPPGTVNLVSETGSEAAKELVISPQVDVLSYTGSTEVGKKIMEAAAGTLKVLSLELGGSAACLVFEDSPLEETVPAIARAGTLWGGQICVAASRVFVHRSRLDEFRDALKNVLKNMVVGPGHDSRSQMGPIIDMPNRNRIRDLVEQAEGMGRVILRGEVPGGDLSRGSFIRPSLVAAHSSEPVASQKEVFGPVLILDSFGSEEEAVQKANHTRFGLAASVWTVDHRRAQRVAGGIRAGTVWFNSHGRLIAEAEMGGYKESGYGRMHGLEGLETFLQTKHVSWKTRN